MSDNSYTIFAFDGGGSKGLYSARLLERIENFGERPLSEYVDMFSGTSTGSIISTCLSLGMTGTEMVHHYKTLTPQVFIKSLIDLDLPYVGKVSTGEARQIFLGSKYSNISFKRILKEVTIERTLGSLINHLCIPAYDAINGEQFLFHNLTKENRALLKNIPLYEIILASSAAPTFLPPHVMKIKNKNYTFYDGGLYANNPTLVALKEVIKWINKENNSIKKVNILSFSCFINQQKKQFNPLAKQSVFTLKDDLMDIFIQSQSITTDSFLENSIEINGIKVNYFRIPTYAKDVAVNGRVDMDSIDKRAMDTMIEHADAVFEQIKDNPIITEILSS